MSNLLERAIIDANALKEAALKNAEKLVIEKYSEEVKQAVNNLLEQDDALGATADLGADPGLDLGMDDMGMEPVPGEPDPAAQGTDTEEEEGLDPESLIGTMPDAFNTDEDEVISIKLDSLEAEYEDEEEGGIGGDDELSDDEIGIDMEDEDQESSF